ncbi:MAG: DNA-packaging protein, partial [Allosphingosinicella sp.]
VRRAVFEAFYIWRAHGGQQEPTGDWRTWLLMAGRGFGKTRAGAEWVSARAREHPGCSIALVAASRDEAAKVMVEGPSGLLAVARADEEMVWWPTKGVVTFASGAEAFVYSAGAPESLRGPQHHFAWCDELAKWRYPEETWDNLQLGLRLGTAPRALVTTTPKAVPLLKRLIETARPEAVTRGRTADNLNLPAAYVEGMEAQYRGTRKGREELDGELIEDFEGALWTRALIEKCRIPSPLQGEGIWKRIVIGVDPPLSVEGDACGIVACAVDREGIGHVLGDHSERGLSPEGWASKAVAAAQAWGADCVVVEKNAGGDMATSVLKTADPALPVHPVHARYGKGDRAEPVAMLFETGKARFAGAFPELEDELCAMVRGGRYAGSGSPDRADAMVYAMTELMLSPVWAEPRIRRL